MLCCFLWSRISFSAQAQEKEYAVGDMASDFELKMIDRKIISLSKLGDAKVAIVIFFCNTCPIVRSFEHQIIGATSKT